MCVCVSRVFVHYLLLFSLLPGQIPGGAADKPSDGSGGIEEHHHHQARPCVECATPLDKHWGAMQPEQLDEPCGMWHRSGCRCCCCSSCCPCCCCTCELAQVSLVSLAKSILTSLAQPGSTNGTMEGQTLSPVRAATLAFPLPLFLTLPLSLSYSPPLYMTSTLLQCVLLCLRRCLLVYCHCRPSPLYRPFYLLTPVPLSPCLVLPQLSSVLYNVLKGNREAVISLGDPKIVFLCLVVVVASAAVAAAMRNPARTNWPFCAHQQHGPS